MEIQSARETDNRQLHKRKKYSGLGPAVQIPNIPDELILEILSRLPVKPLLTFRCVSKSWDSLISSPLLIKTHLTKTSNNHDHPHHRLIFHTFQKCQNNRLKFNFKLCPLHPAIFQHADDTLATQATVMDDHFLVDSLGKNHDINREIVMEDSDDGYVHKVVILGSCNGLLCVYVFGEVFLWNPSIRKSKKLPDFVPKTGSLDSMFYGFGYDESNDDYKVFRVSESNEKWIDVYSQNTNSWRRIEDFKGVLIDQGVYFVNGKLHWTLGSTRGRILTLDLMDEMYGEVEQPKYGEGHVGWDLKLLGGCLAVFYYHQNGHVDLWIMQEYGVKESWTKVVLMINCPHLSYQIFRRPIFLLKDRDILFQFGDGLVLYNPKRKSFTYLHIANVKSLLEVDVYVESLVLLNDNDGVETA